MKKRTANPPKGLHSLIARKDGWALWRRYPDKEGWIRLKLSAETPIEGKAGYEIGGWKTRLARTRDGWLLEQYHPEVYGWIISEMKRFELDTGLDLA